MKSYWLTYELEYPNDFDGFYKWIATKTENAKECGLNTVYFHFDGDVDALKSSLQKAIEHIEESKIYVIYPTNEGGRKGKFLFGNRNLRNGWDVYIKSSIVEEEE